MIQTCTDLLYILKEYVGKYENAPSDRISTKLVALSSIHVVCTYVMYTTHNIHFHRTMHGFYSFIHTQKNVENFSGWLHFQWYESSLGEERFGILLPKLFLATVRKNCSTDRDKLLKFKVEGREFAKILRSLEQFIQTVKGQNNFW